jgi:hypothetical protein
MQIRELTQKKKTELEEGWADPVSGGIGKLAGGGVNLARNVGGAIASPFKDIAQGYKSTRQNQKVSVLADKAFRVWQNYVAQLEQSIAVQPDPVAQKKTEPPAATDAAATPPAATNAAATPPAATNAAATGAQKGQEVTLSKGDKYRFAGQQWVEVDPTTGAETGGAALPAGFQKSLTDLAAKQATAKTPPAAKAPGATPPPANGATATTPPGATPQSADATARGEQNKGFGFNRNTGVAFNSQAEKDAVKAQAGNAPATTTPAKPNYGTQTGAGAKVTYNQPTGVPNPLKQTTPGVKQTTPAVTSATPKRPVTTEYDATVKETNRNALKELQAPAGAVSPALAAFRARTDGKYEAYLTAFVQKNLLAGLGFKGLVNQQEITNAIKAIASPANADPAKQRPLWNDLARATSLAVPTVGALTGRDPKAPKNPDTKQDPGDPNAKKDPNAPGQEPAATAEPAKPTMTRDQISQWISRNSEDRNALKAALDAINSAGKA